MRELKFRFLPKDSNSWHYIIIDDGGFSLDALDYVNDGFISYWGFTQYTGLKDKNGKEIYEGDIFHLGYPNIRYEVVFEYDNYRGKQIGTQAAVGIYHWRNQIEVIGNIYEHPELLTHNTREP